MMYDVDVFRKRFIFDETNEHIKENLHQKYFMGTVAADGRKCLVRVKKSEPFEWSGHFMRDHREFLRYIRLVFDEWMTLVMSQAAHALRVEGFAMDIMEIPSVSGLRLVIKSFVALEKLDSDLERTFLKNNVLLSTFEYQELVRSTLELLVFFERHDMFHGDINPANIMYRKGECRFVPFGVGKLEHNQHLKLDKLTTSRVYCHPLLEYYQEPTIPLHMIQQNDRFAAAMTLLQLGTLCNSRDLLKIKEAFNPAKPAGVKGEAHKHLEHLLGIVAHHYDQKFALLIDELFRGKYHHITDLRVHVYGPNLGIPHHLVDHRHVGQPHLHHHSHETLDPFIQTAPMAGPFYSTFQ